MNLLAHRLSPSPRRARDALAHSEHPALLKLQEFETLRDLAKTANARIYIGFDRELEKNGRE